MRVLALSSVLLAALALLAAPALLAGCVVKYGAPPGAVEGGGGSTSASALSTAAKGQDFSALEARIDALLSAAQDTDQRDRLMAASDFARMSRHLAPEAQAVNHAFLSTLVGIEERGVPYAAPILTSSGRAETRVEPVEEPTPAPAPAPAPEPTPAPGPDVDAMVTSAREALAGADPAGAMALLEPCRDQPCWSQVSALWTEARDALVFQAREKAGARYLESRQITDPEARVAVLREVRSTLSGLMERYPDSPYTEAIRRNLTTVEADLRALGAL